MVSERRPLRGVGLTKFPRLISGQFLWLVMEKESEGGIMIVMKSAVKGHRPM